MASPRLQPATLAARPGGSHSSSGHPEGPPNGHPSRYVKIQRCGPAGGPKVGRVRALRPPRPSKIQKPGMSKRTHVFVLIETKNMCSFGFLSRSREKNVFASPCSQTSLQVRQPDEPLLRSVDCLAMLRLIKCLVDERAP